MARRGRWRAAETALSHIDVAPCLASESDDADLRAADQLEPVERRESLADLTRCPDNALGGLNVPSLAMLHHGSPCRGDDASRPRAEDCGRRVDACWADVRMRG